MSQCVVSFMRRGRWSSLQAFVTLLAACASTTSQPLSERLDPDTTATLTLLSRPVELLADPDSGRGSGADPFAYLAPFETDQMGHRALFLWISAPERARTEIPPQLFCDGRPIGLTPVAGTLRELNLSRAPYTTRNPENPQWYFRLPDDGLKCLAAAGTVRLETQSRQAPPMHFTADRRALAPLEAFAER